MLSVAFGVSNRRLMGQQAAASSTQAAEAARATQLEHRPRLLAVHEAAGLPTSADDVFPAMRPYPTRQREAERSFRILRRPTLVGGREEQEWRCVLELTNVGRGAAIVGQIRLEALSGRSYMSTSGPTVAPGSFESLVCVLTETEPELPSLREAWLDSATEAQRVTLEGQWNVLQHDRVYLLEIRYDDVFDEPAEYLYRAWFDPFHFGAWRAFNPSTGGITTTSNGTYKKAR